MKGREVRAQGLIGNIARWKGWEGLNSWVFRRLRGGVKGMGWCKEVVVVLRGSCGGM